jgi:hypothetical protein
MLQSSIYRGQLRYYILVDTRYLEVDIVGPFICKFQAAIFIPLIYILKMSDPENPNIKSRNTPQWALYQRELFWKDNTGEVPPFSTDPADLEDLAKDALSSGGW